MPIPRCSPPGAWVLGVVWVCLFSGCAGHPRAVLYSSPSVLPHTMVEMKTSGFWINRHPAPDAIVLSTEAIQRFNQTIHDQLQLTKDLSVQPSVMAGAQLRATLRKMLEDLQSRDLMLIDGKKLSAAYWSAARQAVNFEAVPPEISRQYGLVVHYADQRLLPADEGLYAKAGDADFDELQNSALDIGTPVVILHRSLDGEWLWVESSSSGGWVKARNVAATEEEVKLFRSTPFVITTVPKADIYLNREMTDFYGSVLMGTRLPLTRLDGDTAEITIPQRQADGSAVLVPGFTVADGVLEGYLPYTPRNVLTQAFKMLHQPYGWGGMYGAQDCSRFLQEVFAVVGIELPRNSKDQILTGEILAAWENGVSLDEKLRILAESAVGGTTILGMKGHIMLYLGTVDGRAYAIHAAWAYRRPGRAGDETYVLNRVVVSDLSLGEGSKRGSLLERLNAVRIVK